MHLCLPRKVHGRLNSLPTTTNGNEKKGQRERAGGIGGEGEKGRRGENEGENYTQNARFYALA